MARLALAAPVGVAMFALPFIFNCVKRHPAITPLLQRALVAAGGATGGVPPKPASGPWPQPADPFNAATDDPAQANALYSSLWEVVALQQHYYAPVAHLARVFLSPATRAEFVFDPSASGGRKGKKAKAGSAGDQNGGENGGADLLGSTYAGLTAGELERTVRRQGEVAPADVPFEFRPPPADGAALWGRKLTLEAAAGAASGAASTGAARTVGVSASAIAW
jgi:hypothetical protein